MKWLDKLSESERKLLKFGSLFVSIVILWAFVYKPITASIESNKSKKINLIGQLEEMNSVADKITKKNNKNLTITRKSNQPFISWIDDQLAQKKLSQFVTRSEPKDNQTLILLFERIAFDDFVQWLEPLVSQFNIIVSEADVNIVDRENGICNIRITLIENT